MRFHYVPIGGGFWHGGRPFVRDSQETAYSVPGAEPFQFKAEDLIEIENIWGD